MLIVLGKSKVGSHIVAPIVSIAAVSSESGIIIVYMGTLHRWMWIPMAIATIAVAMVTRVLFLPAIRLSLALRHERWSLTGEPVSVRKVCEGSADPWHTSHTLASLVGWKPAGLTAPVAPVGRPGWSWAIERFYGNNFHTGRGFLTFLSKLIFKSLKLQINENLFNIVRFLL